jgi:hypothetical protein
MSPEVSVMREQAPILFWLKFGLLRHMEKRLFGTKEIGRRTRDGRISYTTIIQMVRRVSAFFWKRHVM